MRSIKTKQWTDSSRNEVVRCLGNMLFSVSPKPSRMHCTEVAKKLVMKYPSTRDELGNGYVSLKCFEICLIYLEIILCSLLHCDMHIIIYVDLLNLKNFVNGMEFFYLYMYF